VFSFHDKANETLILSVEKTNRDKIKGSKLIEGVGSGLNYGKNKMGTYASVLKSDIWKSNM